MTVLRVRIACWISKVTGTHSEYVILIALPLQRGCKNVPQCYVIRSLPVLFISVKKGDSIILCFKVNYIYYI
jgi:hypothetical protein